MKYNFLRFPGGKAKAVTFSYDDGCPYDVKLLEIMNRFGLKCTFNLVGEKIAAEAPLSKDFIKENIIGGGHEIACHGYYHRAQNRIRPLEGIREVIDCRQILEDSFGIIVRGMAYPDSVVNRFHEPDAYKRVREQISCLELAYVRSGDGDNQLFTLPEDWYNWIPTAHHDNPRIMTYIDSFNEIDPNKLYSSVRYPRLFYLWGHSYEFENNGNWEHLETICQKLSGKENVWYATNIEICDYVKAYKSLQYSVDGTLVYNPTLYDIWFDVDGRLYCIKPGQTLSVKS